MTLVVDETPRTILIIEDVPINLVIISDVLLQAGYQVLSASDGDQGLELARRALPSLILLDVMMPGIDGFETCRRLKADPATREIPVIFMTALEDTADKVAGFAAGGVDYVIKPFQSEELLARVQTHLALHSMRQKLAAQNLHLLREISERQRAEAALEQARAELEQRVANRTSELAAANASLRTEIAERERAEDARRQIEARYHQSQKLEAIGRLTGSVAHDFNNLITVMMAHCGLMLDMIGPSHPLHSDIEQVQQAADRAAALTRQLLAFSRQQVLEPRVLDLNDVTTTIERMLRRLVGEDVQLVLALAPAIGRVTADRGQLEQVLLNLAVNARDAMPQGGTLTIETANVVLDEAYVVRHGEMSAGRYVLLAVSDTGMGMDSTTQARIFEPFFTTKPQGKGTGLGLATVHGVVKQSGGQIWVYSEPSRGTTFKIYLPQTDGMVESFREAPPPAAHGSETILLVEDEDVVRLLARRILTNSGYTVLEAGHAAAARQLFDLHVGQVDLLLTDLIMPGGTYGHQLAAELVARAPGMKVLFMSGYTEQTIAHQGVLSPGTAFLAKPFTPGGLARKVREVLDGANG